MKPTMTREEAREKLRQACSLIFEVEEQLELDHGDSPAYPRVHGYRARISIGTFQNAIKTEGTFKGDL